jgi:cytoskeletal protein RodZ
LEQSEGKNSDNSYIANKNSSLQKVGEFLREARQGRNLSLEDLSSSLRIGKEQLIALEEGDEKSLPEKVFIRAMIRRIAEKLNLDTSFIFEELNEKKKNVPKENPLIKKEEHKKNKIINPFGMVILSGILGLLTSIMVVKYIDSTQSDSINNQSRYILLENNIYI